MAEHRELTTYSRLRPQRPRGLSPAQTIRSIKLYHRQVYSFAYHRPKLAHVRENDSTTVSHRSPTFLSVFPTFVRTTSSATAPRASQLPNFVNRNHLIVVEKENFATRTAALIIPSVGNRL